MFGLFTSDKLTTVMLLIHYQFNVRPLRPKKDPQKIFIILLQPWVLLVDLVTCVSLDNFFVRMNLDIVVFFQ